MKHTEERQPPDVLTSDTDNATIIEPKEASPDDRAKFRRFRAYNTATWNGPKRENKELIRRQDDLHRFDSLASSLNLTDYQKSRGRGILDDFDCHAFGYSIDHIIFGICVVIANDDVDNGTRYWPRKGNQSGPYPRVADSLDLGWKEQMAAIKKVQSCL